MRLKLLTPIACRPLRLSHGKRLEAGVGVQPRVWRRFPGTLDIAR